MDSSCRPIDPGEQQRKRHKNHKVEASAAKLDEVAEWKDWAAVAGVWVKGLRHSEKEYKFFFSQVVGISWTTYTLLMP